MMSLMKGRFPANLLVSDDILDDGRERHTHGDGRGNVNKDIDRNGAATGSVYGKYEKYTSKGYSQNKGTFSRYFDLDRWESEQTADQQQEQQSMIINGDSEQVLKTLKDNSIDAVITDPPYGIAFMGKDWDKAVPPVAIWREALRVLKPGGFALVMSAPRQDVLSRMIVNLQDAGFDTGFSSIYWAFASGFPKAQNLSKAADKRAGAEREVVGYKPIAYPDTGCWGEPAKNSKKGGPFSSVCAVYGGGDESYDSGKGKGDPITAPATEQARRLEGSYAGFQPKPALEVVLVCMKPLAAKTYIDQAIDNGKGCTWLDDCRIPFSGDGDIKQALSHTGIGQPSSTHGNFGKKSKQQTINNYNPNQKGRFPANLLVSDDVLDDGRERFSHGDNGTHKKGPIDGAFKSFKTKYRECTADTGTFSRYFDLDRWAKESNFPQPDILGNRQKSPVDTFPFLITPKPSKKEKGANNHATVKPVKLFQWLVTMVSRKGDVILDPFSGSGTTGLACQSTDREYIGIELLEEHHLIAAQRLGVKPDSEDRIDNADYLKTLRRSVNLMKASKDRKQYIWLIDEQERMIEEIEQETATA